MDSVVTVVLVDGTVAAVGIAVDAAVVDIAEHTCAVGVENIVAGVVHDWDMAVADDVGVGLHLLRSYTPCLLPTSAC